MKTTRLIATLGLAAGLFVAGAAMAAPKDKKVTNPPVLQEGTGPGTAAPPSGKSQEGAKKDTKIGKAAPAFTLKDSSGKDVSLSDFAGKIVVLEWMNPGCPICKGKVTDGSVAKMMASSREADKDVVFLFINSTAATAGNPSESAEYLSSNKISAPALIDGDGTVGRAYNARTTPHCFVVDAKGVLVYDGAIDDKGSTNYVVNAVKALKAGTEVTPSNTVPYGCSVKYGAKARKKAE
jgi:peroxiredoxin